MKFVEKPLGSLAKNMPNNYKSEQEQIIGSLEGPIVVTGANGFIGSHLLSQIQKVRDDAHGTYNLNRGWRTQAFELKKMHSTPTLEQMNSLLEEIRPKTIFNLAAHGAYSFQSDAKRIFEINLTAVVSLAAWASANGSTLIQAGSSSEYGTNCAGPKEEERCEPNSVYAVSKLAATNYLTNVADANLRFAVLRLYSVYGPGEDYRRLFPQIILQGLNSEFPPFAEEENSRDFLYVDDAVSAFMTVALAAQEKKFKGVLNIGSGVKTSMKRLATFVGAEFGLSKAPKFGEFSRSWDLRDWYSNSSKAEIEISWTPRIEISQGLSSMREWYETAGNYDYLHEPSRDQNDSCEPLIQISAVIACYKDAEAIPVMHSRMKNVLESLEINYEIIFVNDGSPDDTIEVIEEISRKDSHVIGVTHARNFGSQAAFLSGMRESKGENIVLLDGDLQDPPELIAEFWKLKNQGFDVIYGRRVDREAPFFMKIAYKAFYKVFQLVAPFSIPRDAGDFSLMSRQVVDTILQMPERDLFIRAQRAYVGFNQTGVDYVRPERMFGKTTNNLSKNFGWATKGVLAVSRAPLTALSAFSMALFVLSLIAILIQIISKIVAPSIAPEGFVSVSVLILGLGSLNLLAISIVGEYVGRILEEVKRRPRFVRRSITSRGDTNLYGDGEFHKDE